MTKQCLYRWSKRIGLCFAIVLIVLCFAAVFFHQSCARPHVQVPISEPTNLNATQQHSIAPYIRPEVSTFLTVPEWFLVFDPQQYGAYLSMDNTYPSTYPYGQAITQFWGSYCTVYGISTHDQYSFNFQNHGMLAVIGVSFTVEYAIKSLYEHTIGWITEHISGIHTPEDQYAAMVAVSYGDFMPTKPWYAFPYGEAFVGVWRLPWFGEHMIRKWERKFALSMEYGIKMVYAKIIGLGTKATYGAADTVVYALVSHNAADVPANIEGVTIISAISPTTTLLTLPHYQGFTDTAPILAMQSEFVSIAGNNDIVVSVRAGSDYTLPTLSTLLFTHPVLPTTNTMRYVLHVPVTTLSQVLQSTDMTLEHIYDY